MAYTAVQLIALFGIPAAMTIAILKHRLYDIDLIISRAVVCLLSAVVTGVYAGVVRSVQINVPGTVLAWDPSCGGGSGHD